MKKHKKQKWGRILKLFEGYEGAGCEVVDVNQPYLMLTILPQFPIGGVIDRNTIAPFVEDGLGFGKMKSKVRRELLNIAKSANASDDVIEVLLESEHIFWAITPTPLAHVLDDWPLNLVAVVYSLVAEEILNRVLNCAVVMLPLLHTWRLKSHCWFYGPYSPGKLRIGEMSILNPEWKASYRTSYISFPEVKDLTIQHELAFTVFASTWRTLSPLMITDKLKSLFSDDAKWDGYLEAGEAHAKKKLAELEASRSEEIGIHTKISTDRNRYIEWCLLGILGAFHRDMASLYFHLQERSQGARLIRAMQFLTSAQELEFPYRFIASTIALESLFSKEPSEVSFQIAARTAWFLKPNNAVERAEVFDQVISIYRLRSDIVHGRRYSVKKNTDQEVFIEGIIRAIFLALVFNNEVLSLILDKDPKAYENYLTRLSLGEITAENPRAEP